MSVIFQACLQPDREHVIVQCHHITATPGPQDASLSHQLVPRFLVCSAPKDKWGRRAKDSYLPSNSKIEERGWGLPCWCVGGLALLPLLGNTAMVLWDCSSHHPAALPSPTAPLLWLCLSGLRLLVRGMTVSLGDATHLLRPPCRMLPPVQPVRLQSLKTQPYRTR